MATGKPLVNAKPRSRPRAVAFRLAALFLGTVPFFVLEFVLVASGAGHPHLSDDPFVGFSAVKPLFVLSADGTRYETAPARHSHFVPDSFDAAKSTREFRIFTLGGSTVQGNPYSVPTAFTTWLELQLQAADPSRTWQVVNCGGISYATYRLVPIMQELTNRSPDLFIVYAGHNEFLEDRTYEHIKQAPPMISAAHELVSNLRTYNFLRSGFLAITAHRSPRATAKNPSILAEEVEALLDYRGGMEKYRRDDAWRAGVIAHYEFNLRRMVQIAKTARVPIILMNPVSNLRDNPPFKSEHRNGMSEADLARWESIWLDARRQYAKDPKRAAALLNQAIAIDDQFAGIHYDLAKCYEAAGRWGEARREFILAKELDICPLRILEPMHQALLEIAKQTRTPLVDARALFEQLSPGSIPGNEWLVDHVHPSIRGHQRLADALAAEMTAQGLVEFQTGWEQERDLAYAEHLRTLDTIYYFRGQQHLEGLKRWAEGRVSKERAGSKPVASK